MTLTLLAGSAVAADCRRGRFLYDAAQSEIDTKRRIALLRESTDVLSIL